MARHVSGGRQALAATFDDIVRGIGDDEADDFKIVALGLVGPEAVAAAFLHLDAADRLTLFLSELAERGLIDLPAAVAAHPALGRRPIVLPQDASGQRIVLQGWTQDMLDWIDMVDLLTGLSRAARRTCFVNAGDRSGTGFLIGPQTVLTNWHVVVDLIDPATGRAPDGSAARLTCDFDNLTSGTTVTHKAVADWLVDFSPRDLTGVAPGTYPDMTGLRPHALDYCAIRLAGAPGRTRGWYDLADPGRLDRAASVLFVVQHPARQPLQVAIGKDTRADATRPDLMVHFVRTADGSSGGLCLDNRLRVVGLHHSEVQNVPGQFGHNLATFARAIHAANGNLGGHLPRYDRISVLANGDRAVIGRTASQELIREMADSPQRPILYVRGEPKSGKTFSCSLVRDSLEPDRHVVVDLSPLDVPPRAREVAGLILQRAGVRAEEIAALTSGEAPHGTIPAWVANTLLPEFRTALRKRLHADPAKPMLLWLVIDRLDEVDIPATEAREFLDALYADAVATGELRVVLIGLDGPLPALDPRRTMTDEIDHPDNVLPDDIETCIAGLMTARGLAPSRDEIRRHAEVVQAMADMLHAHFAGAPRLSRLSEALASVYLKAAKRWK